MPRWNSSDNKKLADLFRKGPRSNGVDPKALDAKSVETAREELFPKDKYKILHTFSGRIQRLGI